MDTGSVTIGIIANTALLLFHVLTFLLEHRLKPIDLTIGHLALIHVVMLLTEGFIAMDIFEFRYLGDDITCKCVIYLYGLMKGLSISTTCLLSVLQAITLSPRNSCLTKFKQKSLHQNLCCFLFLWVFNMLISGRFLISTATPNVTSHGFMFVTQSCSLLPSSYLLRYISISLLSFQHMSFIGLMVLSSGYMVLLLCRHKRRSQHLHSTSLSPKTSAEQRATQTVLLLMSFFIVMYILDSVIASTSAMLWDCDPIRPLVHMLVGNGYATVSPLLLIRDAVGRWPSIVGPESSKSFKNIIMEDTDLISMAHLGFQVPELSASLDSCDLLAQVSIGIMANTVLLLFHFLTFLLQHRPKPTDLTIGHLAFIHTVMLLTVGFMFIDIYGFQDFWNDITCKCVLYLYRSMRGLSICTTCLLSVLQAITLSPRSSCLAKFKHKSSHYNLCCFLFLWVFNMLISSRFLISTIATPNVSSNSLMFVTESCSLWPISYLVKYICFLLVTFRDVSFIGLMVLSSGYMVILLCKHEKQSQHLHSTSQSSKTSPEQRATQTILLLMSFFMIMYFMDGVISSTSGMFWNQDPIRYCVQMLLGNGYATFSPLVLIGTEKRMIKGLVSMWGRNHSATEAEICGHTVTAGTPRGPRRGSRDSGSAGEWQRTVLVGNTKANKTVDQSLKTKCETNTFIDSFIKERVWDPSMETHNPDMVGQ
ncbi:LOW QUALITY PROTEIN: uncharacterized protein O8D03_006112 [Erethizon dorsatum]